MLLLPLIGCGRGEASKSSRPPPPRQKQLRGKQAVSTPVLGTAKPAPSNLGAGQREAESLLHPQHRFELGLYFWCFGFCGTEPAGSHKTNPGRNPAPCVVLPSS